MTDFPEDDDETVKGYTKLVHPSVAEKVGYVAVLWSYIEHLLILLIMQILDVKPAVLEILVVEMSFLQRINAITTALHTSRKAELFYKWQEIEVFLEVIRTKRNDALHGIWRTENMEHVLTRVKSRRKIHVDVSKKTLEDLEILLHDMTRGILMLMAFYIHLIGAKVSEAVFNPSGPTLDHGQSPKSRAQDQSRALKKAKNQTPNGPKKGPQLSSAQKRALREAGDQKKDDKKP